MTDGVRTGAPWSRRAARRALALTLMVMVLLPWHRLLTLRATGPSAEQALRLGQAYLIAHWVGLAGGLAAALVFSRVVPAVRADALRSASARWLLAPSAAAFGALVGLVALAASAAFSAWGLGRHPALIDGVTQLVHARYLASGALAGPVLEEPAFWQVQFMVSTDGGWVSQYALGYPVLLAAAWGVELAWLVGPLSLGATAFLTALIAERLFPHDRVVARLAAALVAVSPFLSFHAAGFMSHAPASAFAAVAVYGSLRATDDGWGWAVLSGSGVGAAFATRPLVGVVLGLFATVGVWAVAPGRGPLSRREWCARLAAAAASALPFALGVLAYNGSVFGHSTQFGWLAAAGPSQGLGFHVDPWGSPYGLVEALAYTAVDLLGLGLDLLQAPIPVVVLVAVHLFRAERLDAGTRLAATWALLPVLGNAFYWHHDLFMGPRMLYEAAPGWCLLLAASVAGILRDLPASTERRERRPPFSRAGMETTLALALLTALVFSGPRRLATQAGFARSSGMAREAPRTDGPSLVFVHEDWQARLGARMSALGLRLDSIRGVLARFPTCRVEEWVRAREEGAAGSAMLGVADGGGVPELREFVMPSGARFRTLEGETLTAACEREAASDFGGVLPLAPYLWQGDLPGLAGEGPLYVRDLGPERNRDLLFRFPQRRPLLLAARRGGAPELLPYAEAIEEIWTVR